MMAVMHVNIYHDHQWTCL